MGVTYCNGEGVCGKPNSNTFIYPNPITTQ